MDDFSYFKEQLKKYNKVLIKGNPSHPSFVNGFSILSTTGEVELTELGWSDVIQYLEKLKTPMNELEFYKLLKQYLPENDKVAKDLLKEVDSRLNKLEEKEIKYYWCKLCDLIEYTAEKFESDNPDYVDIQVNYDASKILITNLNNN